MRPKIPGVHALQLPIQREPDLGRILGRGDADRKRQSERKCRETADQSHMMLLFENHPIANSSLRSAQPVTRTSIKEKTT